MLRIRAVATSTVSTLSALVALGAVLVACGDSTSSASDTTGAGGQSSTTSVGTGGNGSGTGGGGPSVPTCRPSCAVASDCIEPSPAFDGDNWDCVDTKCVYLGCTDTAECQAAFQSSAYVCGSVAGTTVDICHIACNSATECAQPSPAFDQDNWTCVDGGCHYDGCKSDDECQQSLSSPNYACSVLAGATVPTCNATCTAPADCALASPAYDANNWDCVDAQCVYIGCIGDAECQASFENAAYVCD